MTTNSREFKNEQNLCKWHVLCCSVSKSASPRVSLFTSAHCCFQPPRETNLEVGTTSLSLWFIRISQQLLPRFRCISQQTNFVALKRRFLFKKYQTVGSRNGKIFHIARFPVIFLWMGNFGIIFPWCFAIMQNAWTRLKYRQVDIGSFKGFWFIDLWFLLKLQKWRHHHLTQFDSSIYKTWNTGDPIKCMDK